MVDFERALVIVNSLERAQTKRKAHSTKINFRI